MVFAIDIGNTTVSLAVFKGPRIKTIYSVERGLSVPLLKDKLSRIFRSYHRDSVEAVVVCSVVPAVLGVVESVAKKVLKKRPLVIGKDIPVPIKNRYANPRQVGQDRLISAFAAAQLYGAPAIVIDLGTAITMDVVSEKGDYCGGVIIPGLRLSAESLFQKTALLPMVEIRKPLSLIGKDTRGSILSGLFYGYGQMLQGMVALLKKKVKGRPKVIITGGYANIMCKFIHPAVEVTDPHLVFQGIFLAWKQTKKPSGRNCFRKRIETHA
jgi:type III pantothenate kinase